MSDVSTRIGEVARIIAWTANAGRPGPVRATPAISDMAGLRLGLPSLWSEVWQWPRGPLAPPEWSAGCGTWFEAHITRDDTTVTVRNQTGDGCQLTFRIPDTATLEDLAWHVRAAFRFTFDHTMGLG